MASIPDVHDWLLNLPPISKWNTDEQCFCIYASEPSQPSLNLRVSRFVRSNNAILKFSITADLNSSTSLWSTNPFHIKNNMNYNFDSKALQFLLYGIITDIFNYESYKKTSILVPGMLLEKLSKDTFNLALLTLSIIVCIYEAPQDLRPQSIEELWHRLSIRSSQEAMKQLLRILGPDLEEQWMRSVNLALTNCISEKRSSCQTLSLPSQFFSYSLSTSELWKVQLYSPIVGMNIYEQGSNTTHDSRLLFSLNYQQFKGVIQFIYKVFCRENWIDIMVKVDNIRCDVNQLVSEKLMAKQGYGSDEKHFPSRITLQLIPATLQTDVISVSLSKSSDNPIQELEIERGVVSSIEPTNPPFVGLKVSASETVTTAMRPWKFEQSVHGDCAVLNWLLHDGLNGREVFSKKAPKMAIFRPRSWFRNRYSKASRPFTRQGGVVFAGDEYGESVWWKVCKGAQGKTMEWEIRGKVWLTYWPNKHTTFYSETRVLEFKELMKISLEN